MAGHIQINLGTIETMIIYDSLVISMHVYFKTIDKHKKAVKIKKYNAEDKETIL